jgi:microsomal epoxide hydrolase
MLAWVLAGAQASAQPPMDPQIQGKPFVTSDGVRLSVLEACPPGAERQPVIAFVPGWSMPATIWQRQLAALGAKQCVAALDPRGQGASDVPPGGYTTARRAQDIHEFLGRYPAAVLVGWSLGALEALEYVHRHGDAALRGLVLVDSSVGEDPPPPPSTGFIEGLKRDRRATVADFLRGLFRSPRSEAELAALTEAALRMPLEASLSLFPRGTPREHWRVLARGFRKPLLYVVSEPLAAQAQSLKRHRPATRIEIFEQAGHALFVDEPERFNAVLADFVSSLDK